MDAHGLAPFALHATPCVAALNAAHAGELALIATVVGALSVIGWRAARVMLRDPERYRRLLLEKEPWHPLAMLWTRRGGGQLLRRWGLAFSRLAMIYAVVSFSVASVLVALLIMNHTGMNHAVGPITEFLSKFEAGLSSTAGG